MSSLSEGDLEVVERLSRYTTHQQEDLPELLRLTAMGLFEPGTDVERLMASATVASMRAALKSRSMSVVGKKQELASRLAGVLTPDELASLRKSVLVYHATQQGEIYAKKFRDQRTEGESRWAREAIDAILEGRLKCAGEMVSEKCRRRDCQFGDASVQFGQSPESATHEIGLVYRLDYSDLPMGQLARQRFAAQVALWFALGESTNMVAAHARLEISGEFKCPALSDWLNSASGRKFAVVNGIGDDDDPIANEMQLCALYVGTKIATARNGIVLECLLRSESGEGVRICVGTSCTGCADCERSPQYYEAGKLLDLPRLPRHWGCDCQYQY